MDSFRWIAVALSMILGLGVTRLLSAFVAVFRSRRHSKLDWIPLAWAGCIFLWQLQFWWAIIELPGLIRVWTLGSFLTLVCLTLLLFVSAALVLPSSELAEKDSLAASFDRDGRWSLVSLSAYFVLAVVADWVFWNVSPMSRWGAFDRIDHSASCVSLEPGAALAGSHHPALYPPEHLGGIGTLSCVLQIGLDFNGSDTHFPGIFN